MNRVATWILGTISGVLLALTVLSVPAMAGTGIASSCVSSDSMPCTPTIDQVTVTLPGLSGNAAFPLALVALAILIGLPAWIATPLLALRRGSSARTAILIISVIASALLIVTILLLSANIGDVLNAPKVCLSGTGDLQAQTCYTGSQAYWVALIGMTWAAIGMTMLVAAPAWVMTLTQTARLRQWGWFIFALVLSPVASLLYAFFGSPRPPASLAPEQPVAAPAPAL